MNRAKNKVLNYTFTILLLSVYSITCKGQTGFVKKRTTFSVSTHLKKTYLKISAGDVVQVTASGKMVFHGIPGSAGPDGIDGFADRCMDPVFPFGALLYKIGNDDWVMADPDNPLTADQPGYLKLMVNDNDPSADRGRFSVKVTVTGSKANSGHQIVNRAAPEKPKDSVAPVPNSGAALEKPKDNIAPTPHPGAAITEKSRHRVTQTSHSEITPEKPKDNVTLAPHTTAATPAKAKNNEAPNHHQGATHEKPKDNVIPIPNSTAVTPVKVKDKIAPIPRSTAGILTLSELQRLSSNSANSAKAFLTSKHFRIDTASNSQMIKYDCNSNDVIAYLTKYVKENQATFSTSSAYNYEAIKASLKKYAYTPRELVTKAEGVSKYANSQYSLSIVLFQLNNKPQYLFVVNKL